MENCSFIRLVKNNFALAIRADDPAIAVLPQGGYIMQKPNETFFVISAGSESISFVGGIQVDLVNQCDVVVQNIDSNFFYEGFVDSSGINQIAYEFGNVGTDYYTKLLFLKITDLTNGNVWHSNGFLVTDRNSEKSTRADFFHKGKIHNISYDLAPYKQSIRLADCYDHTPANKREVTQYVTSLGMQVNSRTITTFLRLYKINYMDYLVNDMLEVLFSHQFVYLNGKRVTVSDFKPTAREGDSNFMSGEFTVNPQRENFDFEYQLYESLELVGRSPLGIYSTLVPTEIVGTFNRDVSLVSGAVTLFKDNVLLATFEPGDISLVGGVFTIDISGILVDDADYHIKITSGLFVDSMGNTVEIINGIDWAFSLSDGFYDPIYYDENYYLT